MALRDPRLRQVTGVAARRPCLGADVSAGAAAPHGGLGLFSVDLFSV